jgi:hypothetical protein
MYTSTQYSPFHVLDGLTGCLKFGVHSRYFSRARASVELPPWGRLRSILDS